LTSPLTAGPPSRPRLTFAHPVRPPTSKWPPRNEGPPGLPARKPDLPLARLPFPAGLLGRPRPANPLFSRLRARTLRPEVEKWPPAAPPGRPRPANPFASRLFARTARPEVE
jgi:hypothetical protein